MQPFGVWGLSSPIMEVLIGLKLKHPTSSGISLYSLKVVNSSRTHSVYMNWKNDLDWLDLTFRNQENGLSPAGVYTISTGPFG